jgi:hypothetical protein
VNAGKRGAATTRADVKRARDQLNTFIFMDATILSFKKGAPIKGFRFDRSWGRPGLVRRQRLQGYTKYQCYAAVTMGPDGQVYRSRLYWVPAARGLDSSVLIATVLAPLRAWALGVFGDAPHAWVMDSASIHKSGMTADWMKMHDWIVAPKPPASPDLNRIEKCWIVLKARAHAFRPQSVQAFLQRMQSVWQSLDSDDLAGFMRQLPDAMTRVHAAPGKLDNK